jgi:GT2 family glycosyltransferase
MTSIILLAQHATLLKQCLSRILMHTDGDFEVIVVNDGASHEIAAWLGKADDTKVVTPENLVGVAKGYNLGAASAAGDTLVFIRDHMYVAEGWLDSLTSCLGKHPDAAMVGPVCNDISGTQRLPFSCDSMQQLNNAAQAVFLTKEGRARLATRLIGGLLMVRRDVFNELGGFDERFELETYEDDDLCFRALRRGYRLYVAEDCFVRYETPPALFSDNPDWYTRQLQKNKAAATEKWGFDITEALSGWRYRQTVSLCVLVGNSEASLEGCLSSVSGLVDEIILVDLGSPGGTKHIAAQYGAKIAEIESGVDLAHARNLAGDLATGDYLLWLEPDEYLRAADTDRFKDLLSSLSGDTDYDYVTMRHELPIDDADWATASLRRISLVRRNKRFRWSGEYLDADGNGLHSDIVIARVRRRVSPHRDLSGYEALWSSGGDFPVANVLDFADGLADNGLPEQALKVYERFLQNTEGSAEKRIYACARSADCLMELGRVEEAKGKAMQSFAYALPRAELCCRLGFYFVKEGNYEEAITWYKAALGVPRPDVPEAELHRSSWTWLPHLQLSACYDRLGQHDLVLAHVEAARDSAPQDDVRISALLRQPYSFIHSIQWR